MPLNQAQIKADNTSLLTLQTTLATQVAAVRSTLRQIADLAADAWANGGGACAEYHRGQARNNGLGYKPRSTQNNAPGGNPCPPLPQITIYADDDSAPRDLSQLDLRPISAFDPSLA